MGKYDFELPNMIAKLSGWISIGRSSFNESFLQKHTDELIKMRNFLLELREIKLKELGVIK